MNYLTNLSSLSYIYIYTKIFLIHLFIYVYIWMCRPLQKKYFFSFDFFYALTTCLISVFVSSFNIPFYGFLSIFISTMLYYSITKYNHSNISIISTLFTIGLSFAIYFISVSITFAIACVLLLYNDIIVFILLHCIHLSLLFFISKHKRLTSFIHKLSQVHFNLFFTVVFFTLNIIVVVLFILSPSFALYQPAFPLFLLLIITPLLFIAIHKAIKSYYKKALENSEIAELKKLVLEKDTEINLLTSENLRIAKHNHSLKHNLRHLNFKLANLCLNTEFSSELCITNQVSDIHSLLSFIKANCDSKNIVFKQDCNYSFEHICPKYLSFSDLDILLSDLLTNAIISMDIGRSSSPKLYLHVYSTNNFATIDIYDSGINFKPETLFALGVSSCSTHLDEGGSGMGFLNIFDTLKKSNASITIFEYLDNDYSKCIRICFDNKNEFKVKSHRFEELLLLSKAESNINMVIENL